MGCYIETELETGDDHGKADYLIEKYFAIELPVPPKHIASDGTVGAQPWSDMVVVCVVDNGAFEAAAIAYDQGELDEFGYNLSDKRPKRWLLLNKETAIKLCPKVKERLHE